MGEFFIGTRDFVKKVYIQPVWLDKERSIKIALGELSVDDIDAPTKANVSTAPFAMEKKEDDLEYMKVFVSKEDIKEIKKDLNDTANDFFTKLAEVQAACSNLNNEIIDIKNSKQSIDEDSIVRKILQKIQQTTNVTNTNIDVENIIKEVIKRVPASGNVVYQVPPLEKIKKDFISDARNKIIEDVTKISNEAKKLLKYLESREVEITINEICIKCFLMKQSGGGYGNTAHNYAKELLEISLIEKRPSGRYKGTLKNRIKELLQVHNATEEEIENLYNHIIVELLSEK